MSVKYLLKHKEYSGKDKFISEILKQILIENDDIYLVNLDGAKKDSPIEYCMKEIPDRVYDSGIAEQNMIGIAAGIAQMGKKVFCYTYGPFISMRALEQIYIDVAYNNCPVCIIITSAGISAGEGSTHNSIMDIGTIRMIPNMTVISPSDSNQMKAMMLEYIKSPRPMYIRCSKAQTPLIYENENFEIGQIKKIHEGEDAVMITTGIETVFALEAVQILALENINVKLIDAFTLKPFDSRSFVKIVSGCQKVITVEDHSVIGGLGSIVADIIAINGLKSRLLKIGVPDEFTINGSYDQLYRHYRMDVEGIVDKCRNFIKSN